MNISLNRKFVDLFPIQGFKIIDIGKNPDIDKYRDIFFKYENIEITVIFPIFHLSSLNNNGVYSY